MARRGQTFALAASAPLLGCLADAMSRRSHFGGRDGHSERASRVRPPPQRPLASQCWGWSKTSAGDAAATHTDLWRDFGVKQGHIARAGSGEQLVLKGSQAAFRPATTADTERVRDMKGELMRAEKNPGLRVEPNFIDEEEEQQLARELREVVRKYGFCFDQEKVEVQLVDGDGAAQSSRGQNHSKRVTGRPEARGDEMGVVAPWGYGADLDIEKLPPMLRKLVDRAQAMEGYKLGPLRDCTINHRTGSFFMIHPHVDPLMDGPHCMLLGILSGAVLTFSPKDATPRTGVEVEQRSWTDEDLDLLIRRRSLVGFTGAARYDWRHGIRAGMELQAPELGSRPVTCDFWGSMQFVLPRKEERFSVVLAFADPL